VFLEAAPAHLDPDAIGAELADQTEVVEVHDLHIWEITSGQTAMSAHVLVADQADCHAVRERLEHTLADHGIAHTTLQVDHAETAPLDPHCLDPHGAVFRR
jgi:cobalt-zinc-cadmium efflux system protein